MANQAIFLALITFTALLAVGSGGLPGFAGPRHSCPRQKNTVCVPQANDAEVTQPAELCE